MDKKNSPNIGHNKKTLLNSPVGHIDIKSFDARNIIDGMSKMSFTSRLNFIFEVYEKFIKSLT